MTDTKKAACIFVACLLAVTLVFFYCFRQSREYMGYLLDTAPSDYLALKKQVAPLIYISWGKKQTRQAVVQWVRMRLFDEDVNIMKIRALELGMYFHSKIFFSDEEIIVIWMSMISFDDVNGFRDLCYMLYEKEVTQLTTRELLRAVIISKSPSAYQNSPDFLHYSVDTLMNRLEHNSK